MIAGDWMFQQWNYAVEYLPVNCFGYRPPTQAVMHTTRKTPGPLKTLSQNSPMLLHLGYPWRWLDKKFSTFLSLSLQNAKMIMISSIKSIFIRNN